eukprot:jgi/Botrbrau1/20965/Bobra.0135s0083.1
MSPGVEEAEAEEKERERGAADPPLLPKVRALAPAAEEDEAEAEAEGVPSGGPAVPQLQGAGVSHGAEAEGEALAPSLPPVRGAAAENEEAQEAEPGTALPLVRAPSPVPGKTEEESEEAASGARAPALAPAALPDVRSFSTAVQAPAEAEGEKAPAGLPAIPQVRVETPAEAEGEEGAPTAARAAPPPGDEAESEALTSAAKTTSALAASGPVAASAPAPGEAVREYQGNGCFPDFHSLQDFKLWMDGKLVVGKPVESSTDPHPAGMVSVAVATLAYLSIAFM